MMDYNFDEDNYSRMTNRCNELFLKANNDLQNNMQTKEVREEQRVLPKIRVEAVTPTPNKNMMRNHPTNQIIGTKEKGVMKKIGRAHV